MPLSRRQRIALLLAGVALGASLLAFAALPAGQGTHTDSVTFHASDGPAVNVTGPTNVSVGELFPDANTVSIESTTGNATFTSQGRTNATVNQIGGTTTTLTAIDVATNDLTVDPEDKPEATIGGGTTAFEWRDPTVGDGTPDVSYTASGSPTTLELHGLTPNRRLVAVDQSTGSILDAGMVDSLGVLTLTDLDTGTHDVLLQAADAPSLSNPSPTGDLTAPPSQLQVNVSDDDFPGDTVTVNFTLDGQDVGSDTLTSDGIASTSIPTPMGGAHEWTATATDDANASTTLTASFSVPDTLYIRNESQPDQLVAADVELTFYGTDTVVTRSTSDGTLNLSGLPPEEFFVAVDAPGYYDRTVYVDSLYTQQNVFVLPDENVTTISTRFLLEDFTGQFPEQSRLTISRSLNVSGDTQYRPITSDQFGTEGVTTTLEQGIRYRVEITAPDGTTQDLGPYRATTSETVTLSPGTGQLAPEEYPEGFAAGARQVNDTIFVTYSDPTGTTDSLTIAVYERGSSPRNYLTANTTYTDLGNLTTKFELTANQTESNWVVLFDVERGGESFVIEDVVGATPDGTPIGLSDFWKTVFGVLALYIFGGIFSVLNRAVGALAIGLVGGLLWWTGWLAGATAGVAVVIYLFVAIAYLIYSGRRVG